MPAITLADGVYVTDGSTEASAIMQFDSTTQGALFPRMTTTQRDAISSPATGLTIYNTTTNALNNYNGSSWAAVGGGGSHASDHLTGGSDEIDGDKLDIDYTPTNYTPATTPSEADNADNLTAHLYGIDQALASSSGLSYAILQHDESSGTDAGGTSASTWNARPLDTEVSDTDSIVSITSNTFRPISGTYLIRVAASVFNAGFTRLRLYNIDGTSVVGQGVNGRPATSQGNTDYLELIFTANGTDDYRIEHYSSSAQSGNGLGDAATTGADEIYMTITLVKIG